MIVTIGIDTGSGTGGVGVQGWEPGERKAAFARSYQCDASSLPDLVDWICRAEAEGTADGRTRVTAAGIEDFIKARKGLKGVSPGYIQAQQRECERVLAKYGIPFEARTASMVKNWATDPRLERAGLAGVTAAAAMKHHARDGQRHGLFTAVWDCGLPDPLSRTRPQVTQEASS